MLRRVSFDLVFGSARRSVFSNARRNLLKYHGHGCGIGGGLEVWRRDGEG